MCASFNEKNLMILAKKQAERERVGVPVAPAAVLFNVCVHLWHVDPQEMQCSRKRFRLRTKTSHLLLLHITL